MNMTGTQLRYNDEEYIRPPQGFCPGCGVAQALRIFLKAVGGDICLVTPPGCAAPSILFPQPSLVEGDRLIDVVQCTFGSAAIFAGGIKSALETRGNHTTQVIAWAGDGATFDIGLGALSASAQRNENIIYICYDNEAYMNTGNQKSGSTPLGASTTTSLASGLERGNAKDMMWIMMAHEIPYAATASAAYPDDLMDKAKKAMKIEGFRFFHILTPCVPGWRFSPNLTVRLSKLAVQTKYFPLMEIHDGKSIALKTKFKEKPLVDYIKLQGRFKKLKKETLERMQGQVSERWDRLKRFADI